MSVCGRHKEPVIGCRLCQLMPEDILPDYNKKVEEAEQAGLHACQYCHRQYYLTTNICPFCNESRIL